MDFLDPRKRRSHNIRLITGYILIAIAIGLGTLILVYSAYGFGLNTKTGQIIQNGLLFVDSHPHGGEIYLNGTDQHTTTSARLVLQSGNYTLSIKKAGYRTWQRPLTLPENSVQRYVYPFLFPAKPVSAILKTYSALPTLTTQSPNQRWLLVQTPEPGTDGTQFDMYDTSKLTQAPTIVTLPADLFSGSDATNANLIAVQWASDNNHVLLKHVYAGGSEFIVFDRTNPTDSVNLNRLFNLNPDQVALRNGKTSQVYLFDATAATVSIGDVSKGSVAAPILKHVLAFKAYSGNLISYITDTGAAAGMVNARIWDNGQTYALRTLKAGSQYFLDADQFESHWYYVASSNVEQQVDVYQDPLTQPKASLSAKPTPLFALQVSDPTSEATSPNGQFVSVQNGSQFGVYDLDAQAMYIYKLKPAITAPLVWMDGSHWIGQSAGNVFVMDYDGANQQALVPTLEPSGGLFSADYNHLLTFAASPDGNGVVLQNVDMRAGVDLPKSGQ